MCSTGSWCKHLVILLVIYLIKNWNWIFLYFCFKIVPYLPIFVVKYFFVKYWIVCITLQYVLYQYDIMYIYYHISAVLLLKTKIKLIFNFYFILKYLNKLSLKIFLQLCWKPYLLFSVSLWEILQYLCESIILLDVMAFLLYLECKIRGVARTAITYIYISKHIFNFK